MKILFDLNIKPQRKRTVYSDMQSMKQIQQICRLVKAARVVFSCQRLLCKMYMQMCLFTPAENVSHSRQF